MFGFRMADLKVTDFKMKDFKMTDFRMIDFKAIDFKTPDFKMTDISCCCCCCWLLGADCWLLLMLLLPDAGCPRAAAGSHTLLCFTYIAWAPPHDRLCRRAGLPRKGQKATLSHQATKIALPPVELA